MKKTLLFLLLASSILISWACSSNPASSNMSYGSYGSGNTPTSTPTGNATPTITSTPSGVGATISVIGGPHYALAGSASQLGAPVTITAGQSVIWDNTNSASHPLNIDNGSGSCMVTGNTSFPMTQVFTTSGNYPFHCGIHSSCGNGTCGNSCTGLMVGTIHVN